MKSRIIRIVQRSDPGRQCLSFIRWVLGKEAKVDYDFPNLINIETASVCNLKCIHCPSHHPESHLKPARKHGMMKFSVFNEIMNEIDSKGAREISLHKDGEPLLNKDIIAILDRVKRHVNHNVYLTTNGLLLNHDICEAIVRNRIDRVNVSIGADSSEMYRKIRGGDLSIVKKNMDVLIDRIEAASSACALSVQIIDIEDVDMRTEIDHFKSYWSKKPVKIEIWDELSWGIKQIGDNASTRYPCFSLWNSFTINSDGMVSACCMDWNQSLVIGEFGSDSIETIWKNQVLQEYRQLHMRKDLNSMSLCVKCNYWKWQPKLFRYKAAQHPL